MFEKKLKLVGHGYRAHIEGKTLELKVGFSSKIKRDIPDGFEVLVDINVICIKGADAAAVDTFAAALRRLHPPENYSGTGIRYADECVVLRRK